jgi:PleD family two-component response regulator
MTNPKRPSNPPSGPGPNSTLPSKTPSSPPSRSPSTKPPFNVRDAMTEAHAIAGAGIKRASMPAPMYGMRKTVLLVDEDISSRMKLRAALEPYVDVVEAKDGMEAVDVTGKIAPPAMVISSVSAPKVDGFTLTKIMKGNEKTKKIPVMLISGKNNSQEVTQALVIGACHYFPKTSPISEIVAKIRKILGA